MIVVYLMKMEIVYLLNDLHNPNMAVHMTLIKNQMSTEV